MSLQHEMGWPRPITHRVHEALMNLTVTGALLS